MSWQPAVQPVFVRSQRPSRPVGNLRPLDARESLRACKDSELDRFLVCSPSSRVQLKDAVHPVARTFLASLTNGAFLCSFMPVRTSLGPLSSQILWFGGSSATVPFYLTVLYSVTFISTRSIRKWEKQD